jgi:hypothetical protein
MKTFQKIRNPNGQALSEMLISLPILFLFGAAILQFAILFLSYIQFEHACGEAARQYVAGIIDQDSLSPQINESLGSFGRFFMPNSIVVTIQEPRSKADAVFDKVRSSISRIPFTINYEGYEWAVDAKCRPPFFFNALFPNGVDFHTVMQAYRYKNKW